MPQVEMNCDVRIHRFIALDKEISKTAGISIKASTENGGKKNFLTISVPGLPAPVKIECKGIFTPPNVGVKIKKDPANTNQVTCMPNDETSRCIEFGVDVSSDRDWSILFINGRDPKDGGGMKEYLLITDKTNTLFKVEADDPKIPPDTGEGEALRAHGRKKLQHH